MSEADGITLEYHRGLPIGKLMMRAVAPELQEPDQTLPVQTIAIGSSISWTAPVTSELHFQVNEPIKELSDNTGELNITLSKE